MKKHILVLGSLFIGLICSSCGSDNDTQNNEAIDRLISQHKQAMDSSSRGDQAFQRVLQSLKDGKLGINDAFIRSDQNRDKVNYKGGTKCDPIWEWEMHPPKFENPPEWQTFVIHIVEDGGPPGDHIPYFAYAKEKGADFKVWDMYGRTLLHLLLFSPERSNVEKDLAWLLENTDVKELINERMRDERTTNQTTRQSPLMQAQGHPNLAAIIKKYVPSP